MSALLACEYDEAETVLHILARLLDVEVWVQARSDGRQDLMLSLSIAALCDAPVVAAAQSSSRRPSNECAERRAATYRLGDSLSCFPRASTTPAQPTLSPHPSSFENADPPESKDLPCSSQCESRCRLHAPICLDRYLRPHIIDISRGGSNLDS